jgi:hypothetical protein
MKKKVFVVLGIVLSLVLVCTGVPVLVSAQPIGGAVSTASPYIYFDGSPGTGPPPATLGMYLMTPFPPDPQGSPVTSVAAPTGGVVGFDKPLNHTTVGAGWATWSHGYAGDVYWDYMTDVTLTMPPKTGAFYFYSEPNPFAVYNIEAIADDGTSSGPIPVDGFAGAKYFGFYATEGRSVASIVVSIEGTTSGFAIGEFGIAASFPPGGIDAILTAVEALEAKADALEGKADVIEAKLDRIMPEVSLTLAIVEAIPGAIDALEVKADRLEAKADALEGKADVLEMKADRIEEGIAALEMKADRLEAKDDAIEAKLDALEVKADTIITMVDDLECPPVDIQVLELQNKASFLLGTSVLGVPVDATLVDVLVSLREPLGFTSIMACVTETAITDVGIQLDVVLPEDMEDVKIWQFLVANDDGGCVNEGTTLFYDLGPGGAKGGK